MFTTLIVQPIFNLLVFICAILPGHNFGLAIILFTILIRLLMLPLIRKQLRNAKAMREMQPELKRIKKAANGDRQRESLMMMELYKERGISPLGSLGTMLLQLPILIGLYSGIHRIIVDPNNVVSFAYPFLQHFGWLKELAVDIGKFDQTLLGAVDLTRSALEKGGGIYWPAMLLVIGSAATQYYQSKQLMPTDKNARKLRDILKDAGQGEKADQSEVNAAVGRSTRIFIPAIIFLITVNIASALSLYWFVSGIVAMIQQSRILREDEIDLEKQADKKSPGTKTVIEGEVITRPKTTSSEPSKRGKRRKRRR